MEVEECCGRVCSAFRLVWFSDHELRGWSTDCLSAFVDCRKAEAAETLRLLDARQDSLNRRLDDAPLEDEDISPRRKPPFKRRATSSPQAPA